MTTQLALAALVAVLAVGVAWVLRRRRSHEPPSQPRQWTVPAQLDLADFGDRSNESWTVVVFSSATCDVCQAMVAKAEVLRSAQVAVVDCEFTAAKDTHSKYGIDAVPTTVIADEEGVVRASFVGPVSATDLWAAVAEARSPGSSPDSEACNGSH